MTFNDLLNYYGTQAELARAFDPPLAASTISMWRGRGVPRAKQIELQLITKGRLKADTKEDIAARALLEAAGRKRKSKVAPATAVKTLLKAQARRAAR